MRSLVVLMLLPFACLAQNDSVRFVTSDVSDFWKHYDAFWQDTTANPFQNYIDEGTPALKDFFRYDDAAKILKRAVKAEKTYYDAVRRHPIDVSLYRDSVSIYFRQFKTIYPSAVIPPVYFLIGTMNRGGTASEHGVAIGTERFVDSTFANSRGWNTIPPSTLPKIIARCIVFNHQRPAYTGWTLLRQAIVQGSAEFVWTLFMPGEREALFNTKHYLYGETHEELLVKEFVTRQEDSDMSGWFYDGQKYDRPDQLGSWIGFKITEAYYQSAPDKTKALDDIFKINDFSRFLLLSGYAEMFRN
jgi:hypothetical protein